MHATHLETIQMVQKLSYRLEPGDYERADVVPGYGHVGQQARPAFPPQSASTPIIYGQQNPLRYQYPGGGGGGGRRESTYSTPPPPLPYRPPPPNPYQQQSPPPPPRVQLTRAA